MRRRHNRAESFHPTTIPCRLPTSSPCSPDSPRIESARRYRFQAVCLRLACPAMTRARPLIPPRSARVSLAGRSRRLGVVHQLHHPEFRHHANRECTFRRRRLHLARLAAGTVARAASRRTMVVRSSCGFLEVIEERTSRWAVQKAYRLSPPSLGDFNDPVDGTGAAVALNVVTAGHHPSIQPPAWRLPSDHQQLRSATSPSAPSRWAILFPGSVAVIGNSGRPGGTADFGKYAVVPALPCRRQPRSTPASSATSAILWSVSRVAPNGGSGIPSAPVVEEGQRLSEPFPEFRSAIAGLS